MNALALPMLLAAQAVNPQDADAAVQRGLMFLYAATPARNLYHSAYSTLQPLRMLTFARAGVPPSAPAFQKAIEDNFKFPVESTYDAALLAMAWEQIDRVKYQKEIARCAQFLVDAQTGDGSWSYCSHEALPSWMTVSPPADRAPRSSARSSPPCGHAT
jgi:hypothetical protein